MALLKIIGPKIRDILANVRLFIQFNRLHIHVLRWTIDIFGNPFLLEF